MKKQPYFSVIIPVYKTEEFLDQCLQSLLNQSFTDFECLIVDDKSPVFDLNSKPLAQKIFIDKVSSDSRFFYFRNEINSGQGYSRNIGVEKSYGKRLVFIDSDDYIDSNFLKYAHQKINLFGENKIYYSAVKAFDNKKGNIFKFSNTQKHQCKTNNLKTLLVFPTNTITPINYFWRRDIIEKYNIKYSTIRGGGEDTDFVMKMIFAYFKEFKTLENYIKVDSICYYRIHEDQETKGLKYEIKFFENILENSLKYKISEIKNHNIVYKILLDLFILRFKLYKKRLLTKNYTIKFFINLAVKFLTVSSIILSGSTDYE